MPDRDSTTPSQLPFNFATEDWKPIPGYEGLYAISNLGRVKSFVARGRGPRAKNTERILSLSNGWPYRKIALYRNKEHWQVHIHQLVALTFLGPCPQGKQINHKNGLKSDNRLENLEYISPSDNCKHAVRVGLHRPMSGERHPRAKLNKHQVRLIRRMCQHKIADQCAIGRLFGVAQSAISNIKNDKTWHGFA